MVDEESIITISGLTVEFGGLRALDNVHLHALRGEFLGLIGPNGAGKTTFFNSITGNLIPTKGSISFEGTSLIGKNPAQISHLGVSRTFQNIRIFPKMSVLENVCVPLHSKPTYNVFQALLGLPTVKKQDRALQEEAMSFLHDIGIADYYQHQAGAMSYGLQRRLEIARALAAHPKLLLLDEPAAGMNNRECGELVELLGKIHERYNLSIILIEHHVDVVLELCPRICVLNLGGLLAEGTAQEVQSNPEVIRAYLGERRKHA